MSKRRDLFLVFKEPTNNMAKYSDCTRAIIHIPTKKETILFLDNGCDLNETIVEKGNRLLIMRKRTKGSMENIY